MVGGLLVLLSILLVILIPVIALEEAGLFVVDRIVGLVSWGYLVAFLLRLFAYWRIQIAVVLGCLSCRVVWLRYAALVAGAGSAGVAGCDTGLGK